MVVRLMVMVTAALLGVGVLAMAPPAAHADDGELRVEITGLAPAVLGVGDTLTVSGRVVNDTASELPAPQVRLIMQRHVPGSPEALAAWMLGESSSNTTPLGSVVTPTDTLPAGGGVSFTLTIGTDGTFSQFSAWGPRGIEVEATTGGLTASVRSTLLWYPQEAGIPTAEVTVIAPLTPTEAEWRTAIAESIPVGEAAAPRLLDVIDAVGTDVSLAVDPVLLETTVPTHMPELATIASTAGTTSQERTGQQASLVQSLLATQDRRDLIALPYADADLNSLATSAEGRQLWVSAAHRGSALFADAGLSVENVTWPAITPTTQALSMLDATDTEALVLAPAEMAIDVSRVDISDGALTMSGLVGDTRLGTLLADVAEVGVLPQQRVLADFAVATRQLSEDSTGILAVLPRTIGADAEAGLSEVAARIEALGSAPWVTLTNVRSLLGRTGVLPITLSDDAPAPLLDLQAVTALRTQAIAVENYTQAAGPQIEAHFLPPILMATSITFDADTRAEMTAASAASTSVLVGSVYVQQGSNVTLISDAAALPVTISNDLDVDVTVFVELLPQQSWLQVPDHPQVTIPANSSETIRVPLTAVANGDAVININVTATDGGPSLAPPASSTIRVRAEWEGIGTGVVAALLAIAFVVGLVRTIRRGGRRSASTT